MIVIKVVFWWSVLGVLPYQLLVLRKMYGRSPDVMTKRDVINALPFGMIIIIANIFVYLLYLRDDNVR